MTVSVRPAAVEDFEAATALLEELGRAEVTDATREDCRRIFLAHVEDDRAAHLVAEKAGEPIGFCSLHFRDRLNHPGPDAWVPDLIVTESGRGRGAARALLSEAERLARERGCPWLTLESGHQRVEAHRLYAAFGMEDMGRYFTKLLR